MQRPAKSELSYWRDQALTGACLATARYGAHQFERHVHDELVIVMTEDGAGRCETRAGSDVSGPGTILVCAPGEYHSGRVWEDRAWNYRAIYLDMDGLNALGSVFSADLPESRRLFIPPGLYRDEALSKLLAAAHAGADAPERAPLMERQAHWWQAMGTLFGRYGQPKPALGDVERESRKMAQVRDYLDAHYRENISIDALAALAGLSRFHLMRAFRKEFGIPPHAYASQRRLIEAKKMLAAGHSPAAAAAEVGLYDQSHLNRLFKRAYGVTPGTYAGLHPQ
ncbi:AraC family transcriptional regulator [Trinickia mobilis]|uniref:AraC family transcriptional regulator n=1 Tax=Trinickia mobilis TaxID=2816356 RepID=UPI001A8F7A20|nr:AraC family transcriptional regulator [Trinickia mobilis]